MQLPTWSIKNAAFVLVIVGILALVGVMNYLTMPRLEDPSINIPVYLVTVVYPGTTPEDMEQLIVDPIEDRLEDIDEIEAVTTNISEGVAVVKIDGEFSIDDWDAKYDELVRELGGLREQLPPGVVLYEIEQFKQEERAVVHQVALTSAAAPYAEMEALAEVVEERLESVDGVKKVDLKGYPEQMVRVAIDFQRCAAQNVPPAQIIGILQQNNANIPGGSLDAADRAFSLQTTGGYKDLTALRETVVSSADGKLVYLQDLADVYMAYEDDRWRVRYNGERAMLLTVYVKNSSNIVAVNEELQAVLTGARAELPPTVELHTAFEQAPAIEARVSDFFVNLAQGVLLVGVIILLFLGWRSALIIMLTIPLVVLIGLTLLGYSGFALQQISIAALVIALGLLVDNGIVVIENINGYLAQGMSPREAAARGTGEVGYAIISSTVTTLLAFYPLTQLGGGPGEFLMSLPVTVMLVLSVSLLLALTLSPLLASRLLRYRGERRAPLPQRVLQRVVEQGYRPLLDLGLRFGGVVIALAVVLLVGAVSLFPSIGVSFSRLPISPCC